MVHLHRCTDGIVVVAVASNVHVKLFLAATSKGWHAAPGLTFSMFHHALQIIFQSEQATPQTGCPLPHLIKSSCLITPRKPLLFNGPTPKADSKQIRKNSTGQLIWSGSPDRVSTGWLCWLILLSSTPYYISAPSNQHQEGKVSTIALSSDQR